jgi:hypothetical protein
VEWASDGSSWCVLHHEGGGPIVDNEYNPKTMTDSTTCCVAAEGGFLCELDKEWINSADDTFNIHDILCSASTGWIGCVTGEVSFDANHGNAWTQT